MQTSRTLTKHHGLGNDFLVLADAGWLTPVEATSLALATCDRHRGIGADGLLLILAAPDSSADIAMRLINADGSVAEMSGNGIRCFAQAVTMAGTLPTGTIRIHTDAGLRQVHVSSTDPSSGIAQVTVDMGEVAHEAHPVYGGSGGTTVDLGNPHLVIAVDTLDDIDISVVGPEYEAPYLAGPTHGINVEVMKAINDATIEMVVWERGVGVTQACGTGATASAAVAHRLGLVGSRVTVRQPGGDAIVEINGSRATLIGPSQYICTIEFPWIDGGTHG